MFRNDNETTIELHDACRFQDLKKVNKLLIIDKEKIEVKQLDEIIPVGVSSTLRFGLAAFAMLPLLVAPLSDEFLNNIKNTAGDNKATTTYAFMEPSRLSVGLAGMEIGLWNSIGYISQAIGLRTTAASTVREEDGLFFLYCVFN